MADMFQFLHDAGAPIYPATPEGRPLGKITPEIEIKDGAGLRDYERRGVRRWIFRPADAGLVGVDLDRKNGKNGLVEFIATAGIDPRAGFHVLTPSGGIHLYFLSGGGDYVSSEIRPGVEIKSRAFITLPGSESGKGEYRGIGSPADIQVMPEKLRDALHTRQATTTQALPRDENISLDKIADTLQRQGLAPIPGNRNRYAFQFSRFARKQGHRPGDVQAFLSQLAAGDFTRREIQAAISSAYRGGR